MRAANVLHLGIKELRTLWREPMLLALIVYSFTAAIYAAATAIPETLNRAPIAIVDEDRSPLSERIIQALYPPYFLPPVLIDQAEMDARMDAGIDTFALNIPPDFQRDLLAGRTPTVQLNVDATRMSQAFTGSGYVAAIVAAEAAEFAARHRGSQVPPVTLELRNRFNPTLDPGWFGAVVELINQVTFLSIILTGAALIREREHGTIEHLLVMPVTPFEIMTAKVWAMSLVVFLASAFSLVVVVKGALQVPIEGSTGLYLFAAALNLFACTSLGIFLGTLARTMPQFGLLLVLTIMPLQMLSGGSTPREAMPELVQAVMMAAPTTHYVELAQAVLSRGAGLSVVWPQLLALALIGCVLFVIALAQFRRSMATMG